ncbi:unnamed protein product [Cuscuta epithymum]|uniref:Retrotransposon gag domain-containing protein n=1 Tax=Cuscuta epithymum TaxID=186058 RepID=A0AAV0D0J4_9ASTE|nr:unnamed protein product [Cuscuta epithymum]
MKATKYEKLLHLKQVDMNAKEYYAKFLELARFAPVLVPDEINRARKYISGPDFETNKAICVLGCQTPNEAYTKAFNRDRVRQLQKERLKKGATEESKPRENYL